MPALSHNRLSKSISCLAKKVGERWSTNKKVIRVHADPPKWTVFSGYYISAVWGCWPLKLLHTLEIDQILLALPRPGTGSPKNFKGEHFKFGLKFSLCVPISLGF